MFEIEALKPGQVLGSSFLNPLSTQHTCDMPVKPGSTCSRMLRPIAVIISRSLSQGQVVGCDGFWAARDKVALLIAMRRQSAVAAPMRITAMMYQSGVRCPLRHGEAATGRIVKRCKNKHV